VRARLEAEARETGKAALHARLAAVDPKAASGIPANNLQRVIRALEVYELTGKPISEHWAENPRKSAGAASFIIEWPAAALAERIRERAESMWPALLAEVRGLLKTFRGDEPGFLSLGYREAAACARGELSEAEGLARLISETRAYAKRQRTWFRGQLAGAVAIPGGPLDDMLRRTLEALA
jgi:tRNA dimethylallyltransferase